MPRSSPDRNERDDRRSDRQSVGLLRHVPDPPEGTGRDVEADEGPILELGPMVCFATRPTIPPVRHDDGRGDKTEADDAGEGEQGR